MSKKITLIILLSICVLIYLFLIKTQTKEPMIKTFNDLQDREHVELIVSSSDQTLTVEVVNTPQSTTQGLSGRDAIGAQGMLFIFPTNEARYFWMKDMKFDIDIIWISHNQIVGITRNVPKPQEDTPDYKLETYPSQESVDMVLELGAGESEKYGINPGDVVQLVQ